MKIRTIVVMAGVVGGLSQTGDAFVPRHRAEAPFVVTGRAPRAQVHAAYLDTTLAQHGLDRWHAVWDVDTDIPIRMWGPSVSAAGTVANPATAEAFAREFLASHMRLLAPGASVADFTLVSNVLNPAGDMRSVGFQQSVGGVRVLDSAIGFAFKRDRLQMVSSSAKPNVAVISTRRSFKPDSIKIAATGWLATAGWTTRATAVTDRVIVPIVRPRVRAGLDITYRLADAVEVESLVDHQRWSVWVGADDGVAFARASRLMHTTGTVLFDTPDQSPSGTRSAKPAPFDLDTVDGAATTSDATGVVTWNTNNATTVNPGLAGTFVKVLTAVGGRATATLTLAPAGTVTWDESAVPAADAQLDSFVFANKANAFARANYNPTLAWLDQQLTVNVNVSGICNAFWDPMAGDLNFFPASSQCENTGRIADVVYHEFGHGLHQNSIIPGVGQFDGSLSEGLADTNAATITGDSGLGRGFFFTNDPLRELDPAVKKTWPTASNEVHANGEIIGETLWDLRTGLQNKLGVAAGYAQFIKIYYSIVQRASDIPTTAFPEALAADDDDGDLTNGTPNECEINAAFAAHRIADPTIAAGLSLPSRDNFTVSLAVTPLAGSTCPASGVTGVQVAWRVRGGTAAPLDAMNVNDVWSVDIPTQPDTTVVEYQVTATLGDGSTAVFPNNPADPFYQFYVGNVTPIYCADFENGAADWTHAGTPPTTDEWQAGVPMGLAGDPKVAHGGTNVFGIDLSMDGTYPPMSTNTATTPVIDLMGATAPRLQFYRWLGVEDGFFDRASISVNGEAVWSNFKSATDPTAGAGPEINHTDKEWRFVDVDLTSKASDGKVTVSFGLKSDSFLELGGWTLDDVCIVVPEPSCGNGVVEAGEACDDGNTADGDGCSATCQDEGTGGCCSTGTGPAGPLSLGIVVVGLLLRRRRRR